MCWWLVAGSSLDPRIARERSDQTGFVERCRFGLHHNRRPEKTQSRAGSRSVPASRHCIHPSILTVRCSDRLLSTADAEASKKKPGGKPAVGGGVKTAALKGKAEDDGGMRFTITRHTLSADRSRSFYFVWCVIQQRRKPTPTIKRFLWPAVFYSIKRPF